MDEMEAKRVKETMAEMAARFNPPAVQEKRHAGRPKKDIIKELTEKQKDYFSRALLVAMRNFEVKSAQQVRACIPVADEYVKILQEKFGEDL